MRSDRPSAVATARVSHARAFRAQTRKLVCAWRARARNSQAVARERHELCREWHERGTRGTHGMNESSTSAR
eukprot:11170327-Lingulodinium_polyedra.AAC.1